MGRICFRMGQGEGMKRLRKYVLGCCFSGVFGVFVSYFYWQSENGVGGCQGCLQWDQGLVCRIFQFFILKEGLFGIVVGQQGNVYILFIYLQIVQFLVYMFMGGCEFFSLFVREVLLVLFLVRYLLLVNCCLVLLFLECQRCLFFL